MIISPLARRLLAVALGAGLCLAGVLPLAARPVAHPFAVSTALVSPSIAGNSLFQNPTYAFANDERAATRTSLNGPQQYAGYALTLDPDATIEGVVVRVDAWRAAGSCPVTASVSLSWDGGGSFTTSYKSSALATTDPEGALVLGGPDDQWGHAWTAAELNSGLVVRIMATGMALNCTLALDWIPVQVYYSLPQPTLTATPLLPTPTPTDTPTVLPPTPTPTETPTVSAPTATATDTATVLVPTPTASDTPTVLVPTPTWTHAPTSLPTETPTVLPTATSAPATDTHTPYPSDTPQPTSPATPTDEPTPTDTDAPTPVTPPTATETPTPAASSTPTEAPTDTLTAPTTAEATVPPDPLTPTLSATELPPTVTELPTATEPTATETRAPTATETATAVAYTPTATATRHDTLTRTATAPPVQPDIVINEVLPRPGSDWNADGVANADDEWIEICYSVCVSPRSCR